MKAALSRPTLLRVLISAALLIGVFAWLEPAEIARQVHGLSLPWLAAALATSVLQFTLSAERWHRTATRLGVPLRRRRALADYYLAGFGNQVLPGGVLGDAARAWRHSRSSGRTGPAVRAVVLERASGQAVFAVAVVAIVLATEPGARLLEQVSGPAPTLLMTAIAAAAIAVVLAARIPVLPDWLRILVADARRALLSRGAWPAQLALSLGVLVTCCAMFACAGRMIGVGASFDLMLLVAPAVLLAMLLPISVAGWGVREFAAAGIWAALGLPAAEGVAVSIAYGAICLVASMPGAAILAAEPLRRA
ncbi:MAG: lysylphosphatidylglycerol synthase transmembrane domain-containing protein [Candidatus Wenzhouxiangella sp. M2_3B_020]